MGLGISIFLIAVGAILYFAVSATVSGVSIATVGVVLMVVGAIGLLVALVALGTGRRTSTYVEGGPPRETVVHDRW